MSELHPVGFIHPDRRADVVFVHGLGGDPFSTWRYNKDESSSWPHWLSADLPDIGVWSIGYAASPTGLLGAKRILGEDPNAGYTMAIVYRAGEVLDRMTLQDFGARPIIFVCHSLGGLIVKTLLQMSSAADGDDKAKHRIYEQTRGVMFLATPHAGSNMATLLSVFQRALSTTVSVEDLKLNDANLSGLYNWYARHSKGIRTITYFEQRPIWGQLVVDPLSARTGCGADPVPVDANHLTIAKPEDPRAPVCLALTKLIDYCTAPDFLERMNPSPFRAPCELPPAAEKFFGRAKDLARLIERLRAGKNSAVVGAAGMGKTALAAEALTAVAGAQGRNLSTSPFPDGIVYLDLYRLKGENEAAWHELANKLASASFMDRAKPFDRAQKALTGRRVLVVVESAEESEQIETLLSALALENRRLVLTRNRAQSVPSESVVLDEALSSEDAAALFDSLTDGRVSGAARTDTLALLDGHPLALTWAGGLLGRGDESPSDLVRDWRKQSLPGLADPNQSTHTLQWLFAKSSSGLDADAQLLLGGAALLGRGQFTRKAAAAALGLTHPGSDDRVRGALRGLVQRGFIRLVADGEWQFTHVLGYRFARNENAADPALSSRLGEWLADVMDLALSAKPSHREALLNVLIEHADALLRTDFRQVLWQPFVMFLMMSFWRKVRIAGNPAAWARIWRATDMWLQRAPDSPDWELPRLASKLERAEILIEGGDQGAAHLILSDALSIARENAAANPAEDSWRLLLVRALAVSSHVLAGRGASQLAFDIAKEAVLVSRASADANTADLSRLSDLGNCLDSYGRVTGGRGDLDGARAALLESVEIRRRLIAQRPDRVEWNDNLAGLLVALSRVLQQGGDSVAALASAREGVSIAERLRAADPANVMSQNLLAFCLGRLGEVMQARGDLVGALEQFQGRLTLNQRLVREQAENSRTLGELSASHQAVGGVFHANGQLSLALSSFEEASAIAQRLVARDPQDMSWRFNEVLTLGEVGAIEMAQHEYPKATETFRECLRLTRQLVVDYPGTPWSEDHLKYALTNVGVAYAKSAGTEEARAALTEALQIARRQVAGSLASTDMQLGLSYILLRLGELESNAGGDNALELATESLAVAQALAALDPGRTVFHEAVSRSRALVERIRS